MLSSRKFYMGAREMTGQPWSIPPRVVLYIHAELERRKEYKMKLEMHPVYNGYDDFSMRESQKVRQMYLDAIAKITADIIAITTRHFPGIPIDPNPEVTISNILAALPPPEDIVLKKVLHGGAG